jgi:ABC-type oligopeptide transport system substrate-binding subunit
MPSDWSRMLMRRYSTHVSNYTYGGSPLYDELFTKFSASLNVDEQRQIIKDAEMELLSQHWAIQTVPIVNYVIYQPWFKGFNGEVFKCGGYAQYWINQTLKYSMGR